MGININVGTRHTLRLKVYDYASNGLYFITICTKDRRAYFCDTGADRYPTLNKYGKIVEHGWMNIPNIYCYTVLDEFVIMPNHIHSILKINNPNNSIDINAGHCPAPTNKPKAIGHVIGQFKSAMTKLLRQHNLLEFEWQRNYFEHIIRNEQELNHIREYIINNPLNWAKDEYQHSI